MKTRSLRTYLLVGIWALQLVAVLPALICLGVFLRNDFIEEAHTEAFRALEAASWSLRGRPTFAGAESLDKALKEYEQRTGHRLTYIVGGKVMADSGVPFGDLQQLDDHTVRPEVKAALTSGRGLHRRESLSLHREMIYVAEPVTGVPGIADGILRLAVPVSEIQLRGGRVLLGLGLVLGATLLLAGLAARRVSRILPDALESMAATARHLGAGNYGRRIRHVPWQELQPLAETINQMAENIQARSTELESRRARLEALFKALHQGVILLDAEDRIASMNPAAETIFPPGPHAGRTLLEISMQPELQHLAEAARSGAGRQIREALAFGPGRVFEIGAALLDSPGGEMLLVFRDIAEEDRLERMRRDFVANVSHELKTPLTSIIGYAETLLQVGDPGPERRREFLETILRNADHMSRMVSGLLILAKAEHRAAGAPTDARTDLASVLAEAETVLRPQAEAKSITLELDARDNHPVPGERDALLEVARNLLDNAVKYTQAGGLVRVRAGLQAGKMVVRVEDNGPAIPEEDRERIFERFFRSRNQAGQEAKDGGAGLGLSICRRIIKSLDGDFWLESPLDRAIGTGAAFCFSLRTLPPGEPEMAEKIL